jgi:hypothetical protein
LPSYTPKLTPNGSAMEAYRKAIVLFLSVAINALFGEGRMGPNWSQIATFATQVVQNQRTFPQLRKRSRSKESVLIPDQAPGPACAGSVQSLQHVAKASYPPSRVRGARGASSGMFCAIAQMFARARGASGQINRHSAYFSLACAEPPNLGHQCPIFTKHPFPACAEETLSNGSHRTAVRFPSGKSLLPFHQRPQCPVASLR